jgi:hypothetical protein
MKERFKNDLGMFHKTFNGRNKLECLSLSVTSTRAQYLNASLGAYT